MRRRQHRPDAWGRAPARRQRQSYSELGAAAPRGPPQAGRRRWVFRRQEEAVGAIAAKVRQLARQDALRIHSDARAGALAEEPCQSGDFSPASHVARGTWVATRRSTPTTRQSASSNFRAAPFLAQRVHVRPDSGRARWILAAALCASAGNKGSRRSFPDQPRRSDDWRGDALGGGREVRVPAAHDAGVPNRREAEVERGLVRVPCDTNVVPVEDVLAQVRIPVRRGW